MLRLSQICSHQRPLNITLRKYSFWIRNKVSDKKSLVPKKDVVEDKPFKFLGTQAHHYNPRLELMQYPDQDSHLKNVTTGIAMMALVIYLIFFRQGNDLDEQLDQPFGQTFLQIKEMIVKDEMEKRRAKGHSVIDLEDDLVDIERLRKKYGYDKVV